MNSVQPNQTQLNKPIDIPNTQLGGKTTIFTPLFNGLSYVFLLILFIAGNFKFV